MFFLYHHHDLTRLAELLSVLLDRRQRTSTLNPDSIIVPNHGVGRWLQMQLAQSQGIAANLHMPLLASFIWQLIPQHLPDNLQASDYERNQMRWHLYALLPEVAKKNAAVASYLAGEPQAVHRMQLAEQLADVFDQYLIYRPGLLADWQAGNIKPNAPDNWQAEIWLALTKRLGKNHRAALLHRFIAACSDSANTDINTAELPDTLICFGLGHLPPDYLKFLYALGQRVDVHFLLPNPCDGYWGDIEKQRVVINTPIEDTPGADELGIEADHPLLASLGRGTRDLLRLLYSQELVNIQEPELGQALAYAPPAANTLLARVQAGIISMHAPTKKVDIDPQDVSVQIHACHGPLREVQVLKDQLLDLLGHDPGLAARDIVVMSPNISDYAPAIQSVFGAARGRHYLPFSISDRARGTSHPIVASFQRLVDLPLSRWAASEVLELAAVPAIMRRFGLDEAALATATDWLQQAGVRWGFDAETRQRFGAGDFAQNSWQFGLDRLLLGLAQSDEETLTAGVAPWSQLEGGATATLGGVWYLIHRLHSWQQALESPADAAAWQDRLNAMIDDLFVTETGDRPEQTALGEIHSTVAVLADAARCLQDENLAWHAVREVLTSELAQPGERQPFLSGGITFCGLMPLRAVPFKVICLLGMNDGDFPRQDANRAFNILRARPRLGDQNVRADDRLLFLQALTAAQSVFYISYTGTDTASGDERPPSPLVGEWLDFLHRHYFHGCTRQTFESRLVTHQPMHPFSTRYFTSQPPQSRLFTFAQDWQPASRAGHQARIAAPPFVDGSRIDPPQETTVELSQLRSFFDNPAQHFLRDRMAINLGTDEAEIDDVEPLQLDGLSRYQLRAGLLDRGIAADMDEVATTPDTLWRARGVLPPPPLDTPPFAEQAGQVNALLPIWRDWCNDGVAPDKLDIDFTLDGYRVTGRIENIWSDGIRALRPGRLSMKYKLRAWIDYLAYRSANHTGGLRLAGLTKGGDAVEYAAHVDVDTAQENLIELLTLYREGQQRPITFLPDLAETYLGVLEKKDADSARSAVNKTLTNSHQVSHAAEDAYFSQLLENGELPDDANNQAGFEKLANTICGPVQQKLQEAGAGE